MGLASLICHLPLTNGDSDVGISVDVVLCKANYSSESMRQTSTRLQQDLASRLRLFDMGPTTVHMRIAPSVEVRKNSPHS